MSCPSAKAGPSHLVMMEMDSKARASVIALAFLDRNASAEWMNASMPELAVTAGGHETVRDRIDDGDIGQEVVEATTFLTLISRSRKMACLVTSAPVPAVVGTMIVGLPRREPSPAEIVLGNPGIGDQRGGHLGHIEDAPAAEANDHIELALPARSRPLPPPPRWPARGCPGPGPFTSAIPPPPDRTASSQEGRPS